jgi:hypothetical protein
MLPHFEQGNSTSHTPYNLTTTRTKFRSSCCDQAALLIGSIFVSALYSYNGKGTLLVLLYSDSVACCY